MCGFPRIDVVLSNKLGSRQVYSLCPARKLPSSGALRAFVLVKLYTSCRTARTTYPSASSYS